MKSIFRALPLLLVGCGAVQAALTLDVTSKDSIKDTAGRIAFDMMSYYKGNVSGPGNTLGMLEQANEGHTVGYYWWESGAMWGAMIDYWYYTGDDSYNDVVTEALLFQANSPANDYKPINQSKSLGNDDQAFWGMAVMSAAEANFPNPPSDKPQWLALAMGVFNTQAVQYDFPPATCGGGLRWQIFQFNAGYHYKNSISNGCFFNIAARLGRYTGNQTYFDWAEKTYQWMEDIALITPDYAIFDGTDETKNCTEKDHNRWTYNVGVFLLGAATMYNHSAEQDPNSATTAKWKARTQGLLNGTAIFFQNGVMAEGCEASKKCNVDQRSFKAYLARWMAATTKIAPFTTSFVMDKLKSTAIAAVKTCNGGSTGTLCGTQWTMAGFNGDNGVGEQMCALEVVQSLLINDRPAPLTNGTGGTSKGDPTTGLTSVNDGVVTTSERAGAGIITAILVSGVIAGTAWLVTGA